MRHMKTITKEINKGDIVCFNPTVQIVKGLLRNRSWAKLGGFYLYEVITIGRKWATVWLLFPSVKKRMPVHVWQMIVENKNFTKVINGQHEYINRK